jgi:GNAT superfamily N-acetyltransferase
MPGSGPKHKSYKQNDSLRHAIKKGHEMPAMNQRVFRTKPRKANISIRLLAADDAPQIAAAFEKLGWSQAKPLSQYQRYFNEQARGVRAVHVAFVEGAFAGYLTICWKSAYLPFREQNIPEIVDFNVLPVFRRQGVGTALMDKAESEIMTVSNIAGIGVGLTSDYGAAQRLYVLRGYVPDGRGLYQRNHYPTYGEQVTINDDLALFLTKELR